MQNESETHCYKSFHVDTCTPPPELNMILSHYLSVCGYHGDSQLPGANLIQMAVSDIHHPTLAFPRLSSCVVGVRVGTELLSHENHFYYHSQAVTL